MKLVQETCTRQLARLTCFTAQVFLVEVSCNEQKAARIPCNFVKKFCKCPVQVSEVCVRATRVAQEH